MHNITLRSGTSILALAALVAVGACDDDPVGHHDEHQEPVGLIIASGGTDVVTVDGTTVTGGLSLTVDGDTTVEVQFVDEDGQRFIPDGADEWLRVEIGDAAVAEWSQTTPGSFSGQLTGLEAGSTAAVFELMHGPLNAASAHADYTSPSIPVVVVE